MEQQKKPPFRWIVDFPADEKLTPYGTRPCLKKACYSNDHLAALLSYFIFQASCEADRKKANFEEASIITLKRTLDDILKESKLETSKRSLIIWLRYLNAYGYVLSQPYCKDYTVNIEKLREAIKTPPKMEDKPNVELPSLRGCKSQKVQSANVELQSLSLQVQSLMIEVQSLRNERIEDAQRVEALCAKVELLQSRNELLQSSIELASTFESGVTALENGDEDGSTDPLYLLSLDITKESNTIESDRESVERDALVSSHSFDTAPSSILPDFEGRSFDLTLLPEDDSIIREEIAPNVFRYKRASGLSVGELLPIREYLPEGDVIEADTLQVSETHSQSDADGDSPRLQESMDGLAYSPGATGMTTRPEGEAPHGHFTDRHERGNYRHVTLSGTHFIPDTMPESPTAVSQSASLATLRADSERAGQAASERVTEGEAHSDIQRNYHVDSPHRDGDARPHGYPDAGSVGKQGRAPGEGDSTTVGNVAAKDDPAETEAAEEVVHGLVDMAAPGHSQWVDDAAGAGMGSDSDTEHDRQVVTPDTRPVLETGQEEEVNNGRTNSNLAAMVPSDNEHHLPGVPDRHQEKQEEIDVLSRVWQGVDDEARQERGDNEHEDILQVLRPSGILDDHSTHGANGHRPPGSHGTAGTADVSVVVGAQSGATDGGSRKGARAIDEECAQDGQQLEQMPSREDVPAVAVSLPDASVVEPRHSTPPAMPGAPVPSVVPSKDCGTTLSTHSPTSPLTTSAVVQASTLPNPSSVPNGQGAAFLAKTDVQDSEKEDDMFDTAHMHVLVTSQQFTSVEEWEQGRKDFHQTLSHAWKTANPDFKQQFGDWHGYRKHYGARWLKANPKPADVLPPDVQRILDDWKSLHRKAIPITTSDIDAATMLAPCNPTKEELSACRKWHFTTDDPKKPWYRKIGVSLMDTAKNWSRWQSLQDSGQDEPRTKPSERVLTKEELKRIPV